VNIFTDAEVTKARLDVDHAFETAPDQCDTTRINPFTGAGWAPGLDPIDAQKQEAIRAVLARRWHAINGPADADLQPLPLGYDERETLKRGGATHILAWFARSLAGLDYDVVEHPSFYDYACGVMALVEHVPASITDNTELQRRFPPRPLSGLTSGLMWLPPNEYERYRPTVKLQVATDRKITDQTR